MSRPKAASSPEPQAFSNSVISGFSRSLTESLKKVAGSLYFFTAISGYLGEYGRRRRCKRTSRISRIQSGGIHMPRIMYFNGSLGITSFDVQVEGRPGDWSKASIFEAGKRYRFAVRVLNNAG